MAEQPQSPAQKLIVQETEQQRVERVRVEERKAHAARTMEILAARYGNR
jgi:hypothetical protein